jgi:hypothetical protein
MRDQVGDAQRIACGELCSDPRPYMLPSPSLGPPLLSPSPSPPPPCGMPPLDGSGLVVVVGGGGALVVIGGDCGGLVVMGGASAGAVTAAGEGARTVNVMVARPALVRAKSTSRRWRPGARSWKVRRAAPNRVRRRSSTYRNRVAAPVCVPLTAARTVRLGPVCAPARGETIDKWGVGAVTGSGALLAWAATDAGVLVELLLLPPQPLTARINAKLTHSAPALNVLVTMYLPSVAAIRHSGVDDLAVSISDSEVLCFLPT